MSTVHNTNVACCTIPPVHSDYTPKGKYKPYAGFNKVYVTGPETPGRVAIICVYDIFGFKSQTQQGADIIAEELKAQVLMPDFFEPGEPWPVDKFPPQGEDKKKLQEFFGGLAKPADAVAKLINVARTLELEGVEFVAAYGFCWGGKVAILAGSANSTPLGAVAVVHPAMLAHDDIQHLNIPLGLYPSNDEPSDEVKKMRDIIANKPIAAKSDYKHYDSFHGFAAARANLDDPENKKQYEDLYSRLCGFLCNVSGISTK